MASCRSKQQLVTVIATAFAVIFLITSLVLFHIITNVEDENRVDHFFEGDAYHTLHTSDGNRSVDKQDHRAFVCITGQVTRMELELKVQNLLHPLREAGFSPDVALILSDNNEEIFASKRDEYVTQPLFASYKDTKEFLEERDFNVVTNTPYIQTEHPILNKYYQAELDGTRMDVRAVNHARMFAALVPCYTEMIQASKQMGSDYAFVIRIREDHAFTEPFNVHTVFDELTSNPRTIMTSSCARYGGMNDRFAILTSDAAYDYFVGPILSYYTKPLHEKIRNAETFIYYTYLSLKLKVIKTPKIFNLQKFRIFNGGPVLVPVFQLTYPECGGTDEEKIINKKKRDDIKNKIIKRQDDDDNGGDGSGSASGSRSEDNIVTSSRQDDDNDGSGSGIRSEDNIVTSSRQEDDNDGSGSGSGIRSEDNIVTS